MSHLTIHADNAPIKILVHILAKVAELDPDVTAGTVDGGLELTFGQQDPGAAATVPPIAVPAAAPAPTATVECDRCGKTFKNAAGLGSHIAAQHRPRPAPAPTPPAAAAPHRCADCDRAFPSLQALGTHRTRSHAPLKGVLAAGHIEGAGPADGDDRDAWETRRRNAAAAAL